MEDEDSCDDDDDVDGDDGGSTVLSSLVDAVSVVLDVDVVVVDVTRR